MIQTRLATRRLSGEYIRWAPTGPGGEPQLSLQGGRLGSASYGDYGNVVSLRGGALGSLGEVIRWARLGPGGDPIMSLQGRPVRVGSGCQCSNMKGLGALSDDDTTNMVIGFAAVTAAVVAGIWTAKKVGVL